MQERGVVKEQELIRETENSKLWKATINYDIKYYLKI